MTARRFLGNKAIEELDQQMMQAGLRSTQGRAVWDKARHLLEAHSTKIRTEERAIHLKVLRERYDLIPRQDRWSQERLREDRSSVVPVPIAGGPESG